MVNYTFTQNVKVVVGKNSVEQLGDILIQEGFSKVLLVYDKGIEAVGILSRIERALEGKKLEYVEFGKVLPDPPAGIINEGAQLCKESNCDCIVAIGGGSSIDTGKGINILRFNEGEILDYAVKEIAVCDGLIVVPTTAGTGSELSNGAIVTDLETGAKVPILCFNDMPDYAILDPELTLGMPYGLTLMTGLDAFSHAAESYTSVNANSMTDLVCEKVMTTVIENLPTVLREPQNVEAREKMQCVAAMGGWMLYSASAHVGHSIAHVLGAHFHMPHGATCAYTLPSVFKLLASIMPDKIAYIGRLLGAEINSEMACGEIGRQAAEAFVHFTEGLGLPPVNVPDLSEQEIENLVEKIVEEPLAAFSPIEIDKNLARKMIQDIVQ